MGLSIRDVRKGVLKHRHRNSLGVSKMLRLLRLTAGPEPRQATAAHRPEHTYDSSGRQDGLVNRMSSQHSGRSARMGFFLEIRTKRLYFQDCGHAGTGRHWSSSHRDDIMAR